jgi:hypothetical protein
MSRLFLTAVGLPGLHPRRIGGNRFLSLANCGIGGPVSRGFEPSVPANHDRHRQSVFARRDQLNRYPSDLAQDGSGLNRDTRQAHNLQRAITTDVPARRVAAASGVG